MERGSSALRGAADTMILMECKHKTITVSVDKQKDAEAAAPIFLKRAPHADSCVLERAPTGISLTEHQRTILQLLAKSAALLSHKALCEAWDQTGRSQSTFDRAFRDLKDLHAISEGDHGGYEITEIGRLLS
jgi:hypothetical protein